MVAPVEEEQLGGAEAHLGLRFQGAHQGLQPVRVGLGVVVQEDDDLPAAGADAAVDGAGEAAVGGVAHGAHPGVAPGQEGRRVVCRGVVHHQRLVRGAGLAGDGVQAGGQEVRPVVGGDDQRDARATAHRRESAALLARLARPGFVRPCLQEDDPGAEQGQGEAERHQRGVLPGGEADVPPQEYYGQAHGQGQEEPGGQEGAPGVDGSERPDRRQLPAGLPSTTERLHSLKGRTATGKGGILCASRRGGGTGRRARLRA